MVSDKTILDVPYISLCKTCDPRVGPVMAHNGNNVNTLSIGILGDAT